MTLCDVITRTGIWLNECRRDDFRPGRASVLETARDTTEDTMTTAPNDQALAMPGRPPVVDLAVWQAARDELLIREKAHTREGDALAAARRRAANGGVRPDGRGYRPRRSGPVPGFVPGPRRARGLQAHVVGWRAAPGAVRRLHRHGLAPEGCGVPQRPRRLVRHPNPGPLGRGGLLHRVHGLHPALVLGARRGRADRRGHGKHQLLPARRRPRVPHLLHDGPRQRACRWVLRAAGHDALWPREAWQVSPEGWPEGHDPCWYWRSDADENAVWGPTSRPVPQWTRPGATPVETLGRHGHHH